MKTDFLHLANLIVEAFPTEVAGTYYNSSEKSKNPTGKLLSSYSNLRHLLMNVGLIERNLRFSRHLEPVALQNTTDIEVIEASEVIKNQDYVDKDQLVECWKLTHEKRQEDLKSNFSTHEYMEQYPYLRENDGYELVCVTILTCRMILLNSYFLIQACH